MDITPGTREFRIAKLEYQVLKILNSERDKTPDDLETIGELIIALNDRIGLIKDRVV